MGKKNKSDASFPEMNDLVAGMEDLLRDENGQPLTPDHPQYKKLSALMETMVNTMNDKNDESTFNGPQGQA